MQSVPTYIYINIYVMQRIRQPEVPFYSKWIKLKALTDLNVWQTLQLPAGFIASL